MSQSNPANKSLTLTHISYWPYAGSTEALSYISEASAPPAEAPTAGLSPYLDIQEPLGADGPSAGLYGKFGRLDVTLGSLSPGWASVVRQLKKTGNAGLS